MLRCNSPVLFFFFFFFAIVSSSSKPTRLHDDASALLLFKSKADLWNTLGFFSNRSTCQWRGVTCYRNRVVRLILEDLNLGGTVAPNSVNELDRLRVLSLKNNSLTGSLPDLSGLVKLKTLFLHKNSFSGSFPLSVLGLHRLRNLDLSSNNLTSPIPFGLIFLDQLILLRLECNRFSGTVPPLNQSSLEIFNVSYNNFKGDVPALLLRFGSSSFIGNPRLCGYVLHKECRPRPKFLAQPSSMVLGQFPQIRGGVGHSRFVVILGFGVGALLLFVSVAWLVVKRRRDDGKGDVDVVVCESLEMAEVAVEIQSELEEKVKKLEAKKSASLV